MSSNTTEPAGWLKAQPIMMLGQRHGWRMNLQPRYSSHNGSWYWTELELTRGDEYLQLNWKEPEGKLADTRRYRTAARDTKSFSLATALRIIETPEAE